ncbi:hypothetical protein ACK8P5_25800 (plasmid) [Paenibacillus sp. EC2-1]|uniref:hypothetical protein n=1 Tax=Paenibacillus sp. EC2-1 TaxID=3388665 RepID=UPI003BEEE456
MHPWERELLEYRPRLGLNQNILSTIAEKEAGEKLYEPSVVARRAANVLGSDVVDNLMATLSRASDILSKTDKCLSNNPTYQKYRAAKDEGDLIEAKDVIYDNINNINGIPQLDVIPILEDLKDEMESYLDFMNRELFDGEADYDDTTSIRKKEEDLVSSVLRLESEGKSVDYSRLSTRVQAIAACGDRTGWYRDTVSRCDSYLTSKIKDYALDDVEGLMRYLDKTPEEHIPLMKETMEAAYRKSAAQAIAAYDNMERVGGKEFRDFLDKQMSETRKKVHTVYDTLLTGYDDTPESPGAEAFKMLYQQNADQVPQTFQYMVVENIGNTVLNAEQTEHYFKNLHAKKEAQEYNNLLSLVDEEYDRGNPDREIPRFIKTHQLEAPGTYCG